MPKLVGPNDVKYFSKVGVELYELFMIPLAIKKMKAQEYNNVYNEDINKTFEEPYFIEGYIPDLPSWNNKMTKFGIDETRDFRIFFSLELFEKRNLIPPTLGDHIIVQNENYKVVQLNPVDYGSNLQIPLSYVVDVKRVRVERPEQGSAITKDY